MKTLKKILIIAGVFIMPVFFQMCDYLGHGYFSVNNKSDSTIIVKFRNAECGPDKNDMNDTVITIPSKTDKEIFVSFRGPNHEAEDEYADTMDIFDYFKVAKLSSHDTVYLKKNYRNRINWDYSDKGKWDTSYKLSINNEDL